MTAYINSVTIGISSEIYTGLGTVKLRNGSLIAQGSKIPARSAPYPVGVGSYGEEFDAAYAIVQVKDTLNDRYEFAEIMMVDDDDRVYDRIWKCYNWSRCRISWWYRNYRWKKRWIRLFHRNNICSKCKTYQLKLRHLFMLLKWLKIVLKQKILNFSQHQFKVSLMFMKEHSLVLEENFNKNESNEIFKKNFDATSTDIVNLTNNTISIPNHFFVTGEEVEYRVKQPIIGCTTTGVGATTDHIGIAATTATSPANITYLPDSVFIVKVSGSLVKLAATAENALKVNPVVLDLSSVGIELHIV